MLRLRDPFDYSEPHQAIRMHVQSRRFEATAWRQTGVLVGSVSRLANRFDQAGWFERVVADPLWHDILITFEEYRW